MRHIRRNNLARSLIILFFLICLYVPLSVGRAQRSQYSDAFGKLVQPFLANNCYSCHNLKLKSGDLNLETYKDATSIIPDRETWKLVLEKLRTGEMPPKGLPRPIEAELKAVMRWIRNQFQLAGQLVEQDPGRVTARRLNRAEYNNTVRDLLGIDIRPADDFPQDDSGYGFDNIGDVLSLSPVLVEKYLAAAEKVARAAVFGPERLKPTLVSYQRPERRIAPNATPLFDYDLTGLSLPNAFHITHRFPVDGEYAIRAVLGGFRPSGSGPLQIGFWVDGQRVGVINFDPQGIAPFSGDRQDFTGLTKEFRARITAGDHWVAASLLSMYEGLPNSYRGPNPSNEEMGEAGSSVKMAVNQALIGSLDVGGPYSQMKGPSAENLRTIYTCGHLGGKHHPGCDRKIVANLARRAYRRPVTQQEVNQLVGLVMMVRRQGDSFEEGIVQALQAMLVSPHFLFRIEKERPLGSVRTAYPISQHELASRLSYFLWSSMPDDQLLRCADQGILRQPATLAAQVRRMLQDRKSRALAENFGGQWLELRKLESVKPDQHRFPEFDEYLRMSMRRETELFFESIVRDDRSILDFINGDYTFINERLAQFYRLPDVKGPEFRKVSLTGNIQRSGIITQASILTVSSYPTRTSPVLRGKWILDNILNVPPPPPPPDVPKLDDAEVSSSADLRRQLEQHRKNASCASCHMRMDPLGFGLENFNAIGQWRTQDGKFPVDSSGALPNGKSFNGSQELKVILKGDRDAFTRGLTEKLLTYALGRGVERYDRPVVKKIATRVAANNYRFSSLAMEIVNSLPFQYRKQ